ncbi:MAG TPA: alpha/beta fold hydrolase, partial [Gaiellaceae bacterium]
RASPADAVVSLRAGAGGTLVLAHPIGGGLFAYRELVAALRAGVRVVGLEATEPPRSLGAVASRYAAALDGLEPLVLAGWSAGGVLAHEIACRLVELGAAAPPVVLVDAWPPTREEPEQDELLRSFLFDLSRSMGEEPPPLPRELARLPVAEALGELARERPELARAGVGDLVARYELFATNLRAFERHAPRRYDGPVHVVRPAESELVPEVWSPLARSLTVVEVPGGHYSVLRQPAVLELARAVDRVLDTDR